MIDAMGHSLKLILDFFFQHTHSYGWAIILFALSVKVLLSYPTQKQFESMKEMQALQPLMKKIQDLHKEDKEKGQRETMELFRKHKVNPFSGCILLLIQMPILFALWKAIEMSKDAFKGQTFLWIGSPLADIAPFSGWIGKDLAGPDMPLLLLYGVSMYFSSMMTPSADPTQAQTQKMMAYSMPIMLVVMFWMQKFACAFVLYWLVFNLLSMVHQYFIMKQPPRLQLVEEPPAPVVQKRFAEVEKKKKKRRKRSY
ncbi:MAG: membrane protein insertase YidC [Armatimonadetes bacterium]|nr:membrane protein insertase YidC [Armatimonadota bacterium]